MAQEKAIRFPLQLPALSPVVQAAHEALKGAAGVARVEVELGDIEITVYLTPGALVVESLLAARLEAAGIALQGQEPEERPLAFAPVEEEAPKTPPKPAFAKSLPILGQGPSAPPRPANRISMRWLSVPTREIKEKEARSMEAELLKVPGVSRALVEPKLSRAWVRVRVGEANRDALLSVTKGQPSASAPRSLAIAPSLDDPGLADAIEAKLGANSSVNPASGLMVMRGEKAEEKLVSAARSFGVAAAPRGQAVSRMVAPSLIGAVFAGIVLLSAFLSLGGVPVLPPSLRSVFAGLSVLFLGGVSFLQLYRTDLFRWWAALACVVLSFVWEETSFPEAAAMMAFGVFLSREIERSQRRRSAQALVSLIQRVSTTARVEEQRDGNTLLRDGVSPKIGDVVVVRAKERVPVDGPVVRGRAELSPFDALPSGALRAGESAFAGQEIASGEVSIRANAIEEKTFLGRLITSAEEARANRPAAHRLSRLAPLLVLGVSLLGGGLAFLFWGVTQAVTVALAILFVSSPKAFRVGAETAGAAAISEAARLGLRVEEMRAIETISQASYALFDRSGSLQRGELRVSEVMPLYNQPEENLVRYAAAASNGLAHPITDALVDYARTSEISLPEPEMQDPVPGEGVLASVLGRAVYVGTAELMEENNISVDAVAENVASLEQEGKDIVYVAVDRRLIGFIAVQDTPRRAVKDAVSEIKKLGVKTMLISGGATPSAKALASFAGIEEVRANLPSHRRPWEAESLREDGQIVVAVGDAEQDVPLLQAANVSIGLGSFGDSQPSSFETAKKEPEVVAKAILLGKRFLEASRDSVVFAGVYHGLGVVLCALGLLPIAFAALAGSLFGVLIQALSLRAVLR